MDSKEQELRILSEKVMRGLRIAMRKLVETTAAKNGTLVVSDGKGNPIEVPAKDLLKKLK